VEVAFGWKIEQLVVVLLTHVLKYSERLSNAFWLPETFWVGVDVFLGVPLNVEKLFGYIGVQITFSKQELELLVGDWPGFISCSKPVFTFLNFSSGTVYAGVRYLSALLNRQYEH